MKKVHAATNTHGKTERHGSSVNPGVRKVKGGHAFENVPGGHESDSGSKSEELCGAAHGLYSRAKSGKGDHLGDEALTKR